MKKLPPKVYGRVRARHVIAAVWLVDAQHIVEVT
jgi:hypothetical protein